MHEPRDAFVVIDRDDYRGARAAELVEMVGFEAVCWMAGRITEGLAVPLDAGQRCTGFLLGPDEPASLAVDLRAQYPDARLVAMRREEDASDGELPAGTALLRGAPRLSALRAALIDDEALSRENPLVRALCGVSPAIVQVRRLIEHVALMDAPVLLTGGPGAGKEVVARNLHHLSDRQGGPFIAVHCETASAELLASELLGTERRGPGGAIERQRGRLELAHGGTLYLEAIDAMPFELQRELLRFLQRDTFTPVEGSAPVGVDVRVVGATRHDLEQEVAAGRFRDDLHRHLGAFPIQVPDLRARREDIPLLIAELAQRIEGRRGVTVCLSRSAMAAMTAYDWPGNVRELVDVLEQLANTHPHATVQFEDLPQAIRRAGGRGEADAGNPRAAPRAGVGGYEDPSGRVEARVMLQALARAEGDVAAAAARIGMRRETFVERMRRYGVERDGSGWRARSFPSLRVPPPV